LLNLETIYNDYLDMLQEEREEKYKEYKKWFSASSAGSCYKKQWYKLNEFESEPFDAKTKRLLRLGTIVHEDIEKALKHAEPADNVKVYTEHEIKIPDLNVIGHLDHCLVKHNNNIVDLYISDLKTIAAFSWTNKFGRSAKKKGINSQPTIGHYELQVATYAIGMIEELSLRERSEFDIPYFANENVNISLNIIYYNKNDSRMNVVEVPRDAMDYAIAYWKELNEFVNQDGDVENIPPNGAIGVPMQSWECRYCNYSKICKGS